MDKELSGIEGAKYRMDDILVRGKDKAEHDQRLKPVLDRLAEGACGRRTHVKYFEMLLLSNQTGIFGSYY